MAATEPSDDFRVDLQQRCAVVTGASSGIGRAIALRLAAAGADCLVHAGNNRAGAEEVAGEIRGLGREAEVVVADLGDTEEQDRLCAAAYQWRAEIDIWVNNAGADVLTGEAVALSFDEKLELLWRVDVVAAIRMSRRVGRRMKLAGGGTILNMGWDQASTGMAGDSGEMFSAVKSAVTGFTKSLAQSLAPEVRVNSVAPGWIRTGWAAAASDVWQQRAVRESLLGRWGTPADVASVAHFLVSPSAAFVNGQVIAINGGRQFGPGDSHD
ncbi:MAG: SDR family oxidoreductase [Pirellulales bacterium]